MQVPAENARSGVSDAATHSSPSSTGPSGDRGCAPAQRSLVLHGSDGTALTISAGRCALMAIVNVTPDSFADGGRYADCDRALARIDQVIAEGAELVDIGAESTRPGARPLTADEEFERLRELFAALALRPYAPVLSIDTRHLQTAQRAAEVGFRLLNLTFPQELISPADPRGSGFSSRALKPDAVLRAFDGVVLMHSRGTPATMRQLTDYGPDLCKTVITELADVVSALPDNTLRERVIFDPGLGFAKTTEQSLELLGQIGRLGQALGGPVLVGVSRKSVLGAITGLPVEDRLVPSAVAAALAAYQGAAIVRVHDVAATRAALQVCSAITAASRRAVEPPRGAP